MFDRHRKSLCRIAIAFTVTCFVGRSPAQMPKKAYPSHLPYAFSNFAWWTDDELRTELKKRIPGLGDEVATTTNAEGRIRNTLTAMLKEKGIVGDVQSEEPSPSAFQPPPAVLLTVPDTDIPPVGKPSVIFLLFRPSVVIGNVSVQCNALEAQKAVEDEVASLRAQPFAQGAGSFSKWRVEGVLKSRGYFDSQVLFRHTAPYKSGDHYDVDLTVIVDAGAKYRVGSITADGGPLFEGKDLSPYFSVHSGDPAVPSPFRQLLPELRAFYTQNGFAGVQIKTNPVIDREHATVSYSLQVIPGPVYHLRSIKIEKLPQELESRVRQLLQMSPGDVFQEQAIMNLYRSVHNEPALKDYNFSFAPSRDTTNAEIDLDLRFFKANGEGTVQ